MLVHELLLIVKQSQTLSNAGNSRQHKCTPLFKLTPWSFCGIFHLVLSDGKVEPSICVSPT
jgi:hypothetical protein